MSLPPNERVVGDRGRTVLSEAGRAWPAPPSANSRRRCCIVRLILLALGLFCATFAPACRAGESNTVENIRLSLRKEGFKSDLSEFDFTVPKEVQARSAAVCTDGKVNPQRPVSFLEDYDLLTPVGDHAAVVVWNQEALAYPSGFMGHSYQYDPGTGTNVWPALREMMDDAAVQLDCAATGALSGPIGFNLDATGGSYMLLPHLSGLTYYAKMLGGRAMLALHDHDQDAAWTNLLAATRIVTAWQTEPAEVSEYVRFNCLHTVYNLTWQALQAGNWADGCLARLQHEWEALDLLKIIPDTYAFKRASEVADCRQQNGSEAGEKDVLLFYRDREVEARRAIQSRSWAEMRLLPGVTNATASEVPTANLPGTMRARLSSRGIAMGHLEGGIGLFAKAAEAEARRRLLIAAIALERFHVRRGSYPKSLEALCPDFLEKAPVDFMNGQVLHYSLSSDGRFLLYSVGLDCQDNGGEMAQDKESGREAWRPKPPEPDIVWPLPAPAASASTHAAEIVKQVDDQAAATAGRLAQQAAEAETARQATLKKLLTDPKNQRSTWGGDNSGAPEPVYGGQPLSKFLRLGTNDVSLDAMLTLRQVVTGEEPEVVTYQLPISYDALESIRSPTNAFPHGRLMLLMDCDPDDSFRNDPELNEISRATNGECLLAWNTAFERPGQHAMQAFLEINLGWDKGLAIKGPVKPFFSSNLCQFIPASTLWDDTGAYIDACRLVESNAVYSIEITTKSGAHLKTFNGRATNGIIHADWDLLDDHGQKYTNHSFVSFFHITLPGSGRSQTLRQPQNKLGTSGD